MQAKLSAALRKDDDDAPRPNAPPLAPGSDATSQQLKLKKSSLLGAPSWDELDGRLALNSTADFAELHATCAKMLGNVLSSPAEPKYRKVRPANPNFAAKVYGCKGAPELFALVGFGDRAEPGFLVLPEAADLAPLRRALDALDAHAASRAAADAKRRKEQHEKDAAARAARAQKAQDEAAAAAAPGQYDAAVAASSAMMVDEDEAMVEAVAEFFDAHPALKAGRALDSYEIERQVAGPGGTVVASVVGSAGTQYYEYAAHMKRGADGAWSVLKVEEG